MTNYNLDRTDPQIFDVFAHLEDHDVAATCDGTSDATIHRLVDLLPAIRFTLCAQAKKYPVEKDWPNKPHTADDAIAHLSNGGTVGILCGEPAGGEPAGGVIVIDIDKGAARVLEMYPHWRDHAMITRPDAPDRLKLIVKMATGSRIPDNLPKQTHDGIEIEVLSTGKQAVIAGTHPDGAAYEYNGKPPLVITRLEYDHIGARLSDQPSRPSNVASRATQHSRGAGDRVREDTAKRSDDRVMHPCGPADHASPTSTAATTAPSAERTRVTPLETVQSALDAIDPDCGYDDWLHVLMALHHHELASGTPMMSIAAEWSRKGSKYKQGEVEQKWKSFKRSGVTIGTLFKYAQEAGWQYPARAMIWTVDPSTVLDQIEAYDGDKAGLAEFALELVPDIATLGTVDQEKVYARLKKKGMSERDRERFIRAVTDSKKPCKQPTSDHSDNPYIIRNQSIYLRNVETDPETGAPYDAHILLCNFVARIIADISRDNGQDIERCLSLTGRTQGRDLPPITIPAAEYTKMNWVMTEWGPRLIMTPRCEQQIRHAIQLFSDTITEQTVYTHTGWCIIDGRRVYLTAAGAIGSPQEACDNISVDICKDLQDYCLPTKACDDLPSAVKASLKLLAAAEPHVSYPLWAAIYGAPVAEILPPAYTLWVEGESGAHKSTFVGWMLNHFGERFNEYNMPATWEGTPNSLELLAFLAKDLPLVIDDYRPVTDPYVHRRMAASVQRLTRAAGNRKGRSRMEGGEKNRLRDTTDPRCSLISTSEKGALGKSTNARMLTIALKAGDVRLDKLNELEPMRHLLPHAMSGYIRFLCTHWDKTAEDVREKMATSRLPPSLEGDPHKRLPNALNILYMSFCVGIEYVIDTGVLTSEQGAAECYKCWDVLVKMVEQQSERVEEQDPPYLFLTTGIINLLKAQQVHIASKGGGSSLGGPIGIKNRTDAKYIGWRDDQCIYLLPQAYAEVCKYFQSVGQSFPSDDHTLRRELDNKGWLAKTDTGRLTKLEFDPLTKARKRVLVIPTKLLLEFAQHMGLAEQDLQPHVDSRL